MCVVCTLYNILNTARTNIFYLRRVMLMSCTLPRQNRSFAGDENRAGTGPAGDASAESCRSASVRPAKRRVVSVSFAGPTAIEAEMTTMMVPRLQDTVVVKRTYRLRQPAVPKGSAKRRFFFFFNLIHASG